ncbi:ribbon-helix-helix protein, CopG family [Halogeometricum limi]|uniref:Ribbon-helix-helix protein, copG family n=1 Tax=Halogeometricum limi TaxID=555875 RepID=A0A1I6HVE2_9EURY|nr:ribbon-helix-helix protein, CopG family [Halogeometricum limi]SFR58378.1 Ribbon-helix-helix protein, copG family [Halogeometricum limi]
MTSNTSRAFAGRLPVDEAKLFEAAVEESNRTKSDLVRRAIQYYVSKNPDRLEVLYPDDSLERFTLELMD